MRSDASPHLLLFVTSATAGRPYAATVARRDWYNRTAPRYPPEEGMAIGSYELVYQVCACVAHENERATLLSLTRARSGCSTLCMQHGACFLHNARGTL